tara:strand:- start:252 stop:491 length:240 start_codon:yes stop_codon:yes gene_type:complete
MVVTNMKELCEYVSNKRKARKHQHQAVIRINGSCSGLTNREYRNVKHSQKSSFPKQYKAAYSKIWRGNNEKYDLKNFKL